MIYITELHRVNRRTHIGKMTLGNSAKVLADTIDELHEFMMNPKLETNRQRFNAHSTIPHYVVNEWRRAEAIALGAVEINGAKLAKLALIHQRNESN